MREPRARKDGEERGCKKGKTAKEGVDGAESMVLSLGINTYERHSPSIWLKSQ